MLIPINKKKFIYLPTLKQ